MELLTRQDCSRLAVLHCESLPDSSVSELGARYAESFYAYMSRSPAERVFVLREQGEIVSGCVLSLRPKSLPRRLLLHTPLLFHLPRWWLRKWLNRESRPVARSQFPVHGPLPDQLPELILVFTAAKARGQGAGAALLAQCEQYLAEVGYAEYMVKTVDHESNRALNFYSKHGFVPFARACERDRIFQVFRKPLGKSNPMHSSIP